jgi:hypothetical protein
MARQPPSVAEAVPKAVDDLGADADGVAIHIPDELAEVYADPALLERILANLLSNAVRHSPPDQPPAITASEHAGSKSAAMRRSAPPLYTPLSRAPGRPWENKGRTHVPKQCGSRRHAVAYRRPSHQPKRHLVVSIVSRRYSRSPLLIRGFGVRVPGGAPVLTRPYSHLAMWL